LWELDVIHKRKMTVTLGIVYCFNSSRNSSRNSIEQCSTDYPGTLQVTG